MTLLVGLDIGTTNIKAVLYDTELGRIAGMASRPTPVHHPTLGRSEHDPDTLWQTIASCLREVVADHPITGLGISSFAEAGLPLDASGRSLYPIIAWYDRRPEPQAAWWETQLSAKALHAITGQRVSPSFGVNKWLWIRDNEPGIAAQMSKWLSVPDYVLWRLTGEQATDYTIASRTLLFDQKTLDWSDQMLNLAHLDAQNLPQALPSGTLVGIVTPRASAATGVPIGTLCVLGGHDHLCAALAAGAYRPGAVIDSSGTAQALVTLIPDFHTGAFVAQAGYACYAYVVSGQYVLKGGLKAAGGAIEWLARQLAGPDSKSSELFYATLEAAAKGGVGQRAGPLWLPHLMGSGTPEGDRYSRGALVGVQIEHERGDIFRGMIESLAFWLRHNLAEIETLTKQRAQQVTLLGGTTRLRLQNQIKADVLNLPVAIPHLPEAAATGAALLAGLGAGVFATPTAAVDSLSYNDEVLTPDPARAEWYAQLYERVYHPLYKALRDVHHTMERIEREK
ncbi:MAG: FGGY-family carbohydrate kinase [Chloroflexi bacterium]|nr:FGGY-family carbohydrate kinase [Chloroflexota bacterium]